MNRHEENDGAYGYHKRYGRAKGNPEFCDRCGKQYKGHGLWNAVFMAGVQTGLLCPACQTPEENAEAEIQDATLDYYRDAQGRVRARPKFRPES